MSVQSYVSACHCFNTSNKTQNLTFSNTITTKKYNMFILSVHLLENNSYICIQVEVSSYEIYQP